MNIYKIFMPTGKRGMPVAVLPIHGRS